MSVDRGPRQGPETPSALASALAALWFLGLTLAILAPVLRAPTDLLLGTPMERPAGQVIRDDQLMVVGTIIRNARAWAGPEELRGDGQCFPFERSYTLGEHMFGNGLLAALPWALTGEPILAYNVMAGATLWIPAFGTFLLVYAMTGSMAGALVAGTLGGFARIRITDFAHPYVHGDIWAPFALFFLYRLFRRRDLASAVALGSVFALQMLESLYSLLSALLLVGGAGLFFLIRDRHVLGAVLPRLVLGAAIPLGTAWFVFAPYLETAAQWTTLGGRTSMLNWLGSFLPGHPGFPGVVATVLVTAALFLRLRTGPSRSWPWDGRILFTVLAFLIAWSSSHGIRGGGFVLPSPLILVRDLVPGLDAVRALAAIKSGTYLALAIVAGLGAAALVEKQSRGTAIAIALALSLLGWGESLLPGYATAVFGRPIYDEALTYAPADDDRRHLESLPPGPLVDLPIQPGHKHDDAEYIFASAFHGQPVAACYNSFPSPIFRQIGALTQKPTNPTMPTALAALGFRTLLVHWDRLPAPKRTRLRGRLGTPGSGLEELSRSRSLTSFRLPEAPPVRSDPAVLQPARRSAPQQLRRKDRELSLRIRNESEHYYRGALPFRPSDLRLTWIDRAGDVHERWDVRALLPPLVPPGETTTWHLPLPRRPPLGEWRVEVALAATPEHLLAHTDEVSVTRKRRARPQPSS